jgi:O-antigen/teichoic acid export membrane protein
VSGIALGVTLLFYVALFLGGWHLLPLLFGRSFERYTELISPIALGQVFSAVGIGFLLLIKVQRRGQFLLTSRVILTVIGLILAAWGATELGVVGAAWGFTGGLFLSTVVVGLAALRPPSKAPSSAQLPDTATEFERNP